MEQLNLESLGQRIVQAAELAVAMHLYQAVDPDGQHGRGNGDQSEPLDGRHRAAARQRVVIGGAGPCLIDD
jgi:hypothetical protein